MNSSATGPEQLSAFIEKRRDKIIAEWTAYARSMHPWSAGLSEKELRDHAEELIDAFVVDMRAPQSSGQKDEKSKGTKAPGALGGVGKVHAIQRLESGLNLEQLVSEYRALRGSVLRLWEQDHIDKVGEMTRFNEAIDETLAASTAWYASKVSETRELFLAILSHDLRNPLSSIVIGATLLSSSSSLDVRELGVATRIVNSSRRMGRMVGDLLDLTRTRLGGGIPVVLSSVDLVPLFRQVIAELEAVYPDRVVGLDAPDDVIGEWDGDRLTQVFSNLIANALQNGGDEPVEVEIEVDGDDVVVAVHNGGDPIPDGMLKRIFDPMVRQPTAGADHNSSGLGLGLYIAREIVGAHGGSIDVVSEKADGTTFTVRLPRKPKRKAAADSIEPE